MQPPAHDWSLVVTEDTPNHWVATAGDLVILFLYEGSREDLRHVHIAGETVERLAKERGAPVKLLCVLSPHPRPPSARVRDAAIQTSRRLTALVARSCLVIPGTGFGPAIQRGVVTGIVGFVRPKGFKVVPAIPEALTDLLGPTHPAYPTLRAACEARVGVMQDRK